MPRVTLKTLAAETGLSKFAVSRALSGKSGVSDETRRKVLEVAANLGYEKPKPTQALTIGVVFDELDAINSELHMQIQNGIRRETQRHGFDLQVHWINKPDELEKFARETAGLVVAGRHASSDLPSLYAGDTPIVRVGWLSPLEKVDLVNATDHEAASAVAEYLLGLGHREIAYVHGTPGYRGRLERLYGLREVIEAQENAKLYNLIWDESSRFADAYDQLKQQGAKPTAFFCSHDGLAVTVMSRLLSRGYRIPEDVSVVGFGDFSAARQVQPQLTTVRIHGVEMGAMTVNLLAERIRNKGAWQYPLRINVPCEIIERSSSGPAPSRVAPGAS